MSEVKRGKGGSFKMNQPKGVGRIAASEIAISTLLKATVKIKERKNLPAGKNKFFPGR